MLDVGPKALNQNHEGSQKWASPTESVFFNLLGASKHSLKMTAFTEARYPNQTNEELLCLK